MLLLPKTKKMAMLEGFWPAGSVSHGQQCQTLPTLQVSDFSSAAIETLLKYVQRTGSSHPARLVWRVKLWAGSDNSCFQPGLLSAFSQTQDSRELIPSLINPFPTECVPGVAGITQALIFVCTVECASYFALQSFANNYFYNIFFSY